MESPKRTILISGQARLPRGLSENQLIQVVVEVDESTGEVTEVAVHPSLPVIQNFIRREMIGINLDSGLPALLETIEGRFLHRSKMGILTALKDLHREYRESKNGDSPLPSRRLDGFRW